MTSPSLIERLQAATEGSREFDGEIARLEGWTLSKSPRDARPYWRRPGVIDWFLRVDAGPPRYTTSINDALLLLARGTLWATGSMEEGPFARLCWPQADGGYVGGYHQATGASAPLALCIAALKARGLSGDKSEPAQSIPSPKGPVRRGEE